MMRKPSVAEGMFDTVCTRRQFLAALSGGLPALALSGCRPRAVQPVSTPNPVNAPGYFSDISNAAGIHFEQGHQGRLPLTILDTIGSGCAFLDYDGDGWLDILLIGQPSCALYRNRRDGTFEEVTRKAGLAKEGHWLGCAVGDFDNDGHPDLYVSGYNCGALYRNTGSGAFENVTAANHIEPHGWETSCGFLNTRGDDKLDLYVARYVAFATTSKQECAKNGVITACGPLIYPPARGTFYRNTGSTFMDATAASGLDKQAGNGLGVAFGDFDHSGRMSIALANDEMPANLFRNLGDGRFQDVAQDAGTAFDTRGTTYGGMGIEWGDYNNDGKLDLAVGTYMNEPMGLYRNYGNGLFIDEADRAGVAGPTYPWVNFGIRFFDYDNDGFLDLVMANGHVQAGMDALGGANSYAQAMQLFHNEDGEHFSLVSAGIAGLPFQRRMVGRGLAVGDYDNDGGLDVLAMDAEGRARLLHNDLPSRGHWIEFDLRGPGGAEGAAVQLEAGSHRLMRQITTSGSYLSANPTRVHFGLGSADEASNIKIQWPGGRVQQFSSLQANHIWRIRIGETPAAI